MKPVVQALLVGLVAASPAIGQTRPVTGRMTCAEATALVKRLGEAVLNTGSGVPERIVRDRGFCDMMQIAELRFAPTRDNPQCPVGYRCKEPDYDGWNWE